MDTSKDVLHCYDTWHLPSVTVQDFDAVTRQLSCAPGIDLPGRVSQQSEPIWVADIVAEPDFPRALMASKDGLHTAFCFPIISGGMLHGVMEFFSREMRPVDHDLMQAMTTIGASIGQFMKRRHVEQALEYQALHDALTSLPNRVLFQDRLERALPVARGERSHLAVLLLDLDRFKEVNDTFGHRHGDLLLQQAALRLQSGVRESDTVARLGGDEFGVLLPATERAGAVAVANKILESLQRPFVVEREALRIGASIGIALYTDHGKDATALLQHADIAMYIAKRGRRGLAVYTAEEDDHSPSRFALGVALRESIEQDQLLLHYQPKINVTTGQVDMVEALVRWQHGERGLLLPAEFIPLAEESGLMKALTHWVLREALRQCAWWQQVGIDLCVAVNISTQSLHDPELGETIARLLEASDVQPSRLTVEITESAIMVDSMGAVATLARLHETGVRIAIDDFGTGYSSLAHLRRLPVDEIKIDRSFVMDMLANANDGHITQSVIDLGHNLGLEVVAEGVEDQETWERLVAMGCDQGQGYYLSRPVPASELTSWLTHSPPEAAQSHARPGRQLRSLGPPGA
jgi:diguanylate cyclase (GGDEF)-like protein